MENRGYSIYEIGILGGNDKGEIKFILFLMFLRYLSQHNISYVRVEDEVHFLDKIYTFYNSKDNSLEDTLEKIYKTLNELEVSKRLSNIDDELIEFTTIEERVDNKYPIPDYNKKKLIKMQNRRNSLKIKNSRK